MLLFDCFKSSSRAKGRDSIVERNLTNRQIACQLVKIYHDC